MSLRGFQTPGRPGSGDIGNAKATVLGSVAVRHSLSPEAKRRIQRPGILPMESPATLGFTAR
jgi:hypothetical protein